MQWFVKLIIIDSFERILYNISVNNYMNIHLAFFNKSRSYEEKVEFSYFRKEMTI